MIVTDANLPLKVHCRFLCFFFSEKEAIVFTVGKEQLYIIRQDREKAEKLQIWNKSAFSNRLKKKRKEKENDLEIHHHKKMKKKKSFHTSCGFFFF